MAVNGDLIKITCTYRMAANATTKRIRIYFGARVIADSGITSLNNTIFNITGYISRTIAATHQYAQLIAVGTDTHLNWLTNLIGDCYFPSEPLEDLAGDVVVKSTVQLGAGAALNDVIQDMFIVEFLKKP